MPLIIARSKMAPLVELAIGRQVGLGCDTQDLAPVNDDGAVEDPVAIAQRRTDDDDREQVSGLSDEVVECILRGVEHRVLEEEVLERVAGQAELGEDGESDRVGVTRARLGEQGLGIGGRFGEFDGQRARRDAGETMGVGRPKLHSRDPRRGAPEPNLCWQGLGHLKQGRPCWTSPHVC